MIVRSPTSVLFHLSVDKSSFGSKSICPFVLILWYVTSVNSISILSAFGATLNTI
ncbi:hypothetical protein EVA_19423 [gut metagenome]|uniref:Uncharacterized protein n=1 Tax=gut metagenome TaxID=749906 RepID=J9BY20_9ZZZZ